MVEAMSAFLLDSISDTLQMEADNALTTKRRKDYRRKTAMNQRLLRVTGTGQLKARPDMTRITMTLEGIRKDYDKALRSSAEDTDSLKHFLEMEGFKRDEVKTLSFSVDIENESYRDKSGSWKSRFAGYKYRHVLKVEFPSDNKRLGDILNLIAGNAVVRPEFQFSFFVKDEEAAKNELLGKAVADAKSKAEILAAAAGVKIKEIVNIDYSWGKIDLEVRPMRMEYMEERFLQPDCSMDIEPDDVEISDTVTVVWGIE